MQLSIYLYWVRFHPTCFGPPTGPSSGVSRAANSCRHLAHAVLPYIRVSADGGHVVLLEALICDLQKMHGTENLKFIIHSCILLVIFVYYILQNTPATTCARSSHSEDGDSKYLRNVRTRFSSRCETPKDRPSFEEPPLCKPENLHIVTVYCIRLVLYQCLRATWTLHLCTRLYGVTSQHTATIIFT
jgi:hypothetical protein